MQFQIEVNNSAIEVAEGQTLLSALRQNGFKVPTLCHMNNFTPTGACRLCVVEVEGKRDLVTSCSYPVEKGMKVKTNSRRVIRARKALVELLLSNHPDDCLYCERNGNCELQRLAEDLNVRERKFFGKKQQRYPDNSSSSVFRDPAKCVLCSRCVRICEEVQLVTAIDFIGRGDSTRINSAFHKGLNVSSCINCGQCIMCCPTGALTDISHIEKTQAALENKNKELVFLLSPSAIVSVAEHSGMKINSELEGKIISLLRKIGADKVFSMGSGCDINIAGDARQLMEKIEKGNSFPLLSSECPSWVRYVEGFRPDLIPHLSTTKSPQQLMGSLVKSLYAEKEGKKAEKIYAVSVIPCVGKKYEASREEMTHTGISEIDAVLTVRELLHMFRTYGLDIESGQKDNYDDFFGNPSAAAWKMTYSGGKAEAVANEIFGRKNENSKESFRFSLPKNSHLRKETKIRINNKIYGFAWVSGIAEAESYLSELKQENRNDIHYIEVAACQGGCVGGGGHPVHSDPEKPKNRKKISNEMEKQFPVKRAGENPFVEVIENLRRSSSEDEKPAVSFETRFVSRNDILR